jgi:hypothetical protein
MDTQKRVGAKYWQRLSGVDFYGIHQDWDVDSLVVPSTQKSIRNTKNTRKNQKITPKDCPFLRRDVERSWLSATKWWRLIDSRLTKFAMLDLFPATSTRDASVFPHTLPPPTLRAASQP